MKCAGSFGLIFALMFGLSLVLPAVPIQQPTQQTEHKPYKRLIMTDGSYELISQYSVQGERVRYFSAERFAWEELPFSMIDWIATEEFAVLEAHNMDKRNIEALDKAAAERREEEERNPMVAEGMRLPSPEGVFLMDVYQGKSELNQLIQSGGEWKKNTGGNILRGIINPIAGSKQTVELKGLRARIQSHVTAPVIYFAIDPSDSEMGYDSETAKEHIRMIRCKKNKLNRVVAIFDIAIYGKVRDKAEYIESEIERISNYWVKIIPSNPLKPGEYAIAEFDDKGSMNQFVWDFGVDPAAPPNPARILMKPDRKEPILIQKPHKMETSDPFLPQ